MSVIDDIDEELDLFDSKRPVWPLYGALIATVSHSRAAWVLPVPDCVDKRQAGRTLTFLPRTSRPLASAVLPGNVATQKTPRGALCK